MHLWKLQRIPAQNGSSHTQISLTTYSTYPSHQPTYTICLIAYPVHLPYWLKHLFHPPIPVTYAIHLSHLSTPCALPTPSAYPIPLSQSSIPPAYPDYLFHLLILSTYPTCLSLPLIRSIYLTHPSHPTIPPTYSMCCWDAGVDYQNKSGKNWCRLLMTDCRFNATRLKFSHVTKMLYIPAYQNSDTTRLSVTKQKS